VNLPSGAAPSGDVIAGSRLFVADAANNVIDVYTLPVTGSSTPAFSFPANHVLEIAVDGSGNLYACSNALAAVLVFTPPFSASSVPALTFRNGLVNPVGVAAGS
jgi:hypothetical protein